MSFFEWNLSSISGNTFIGFQNYKNVLTDPVFHTSFINTIAYTLVTVPGQMVLGLLVAVFINNILRFKITFRVLYYLPVITSWVIVSLVFKYIFNTEGFLNYLIVEIFRLAPENIRWLDSRGNAMLVAELLGIWKGVGWNMVIFLAALQSVPVELYEVSDIDGCSSIRKFFYITLPSIKGTILFSLVMLTIGAFNVFTSIKLITDGKPAHQTQTILTWMYYKAFGTAKFGYSAALSFIIALVISAITIVQFRFIKTEKE